ncbi:MAG: hypothetical protein FJY21_10470 [Bacteroidetes bacterium]|nr:hypothetical protein [Bacteroidota bacterium]
MSRNYSRRQFLKNNSIAGLGTLSGLGLISDVFAGELNVNQGYQSESRLEQLGGKSLQELLNHHRSYLNDVYIPNWERGIDHQYGGFANAISPGQTPDFEKKGMYFQGRAVWMFAYLFNHVTQNKKHLEAAIKGRDFLIKSALIPDYRWASFVSRDGREILSEPLDHYGDIYMMQGLAELYRASNDPKDLDLAIKTAISIKDRLLSPSYQHVEAHTESLEPGTRRLPSWQHFLAGLTILLTIKRDPVVEKIARYCVRVICEHHWRPEHGVLLELLDDQFRPYSFDANNWGKFYPQGVSGWHSIQACWMVMNDALRVGHFPTYRKGLEMGISTLKKTYMMGKGMPSDMNNGGLSLSHPGGQLNENGNIVWGALDDVLVFCLIAIEHGRDSQIIDYYNDCFKIYWSQPEKIVINGLLHTPRQFFYSIEILERIIGRGAKVSGILPKS